MNVHKDCYIWALEKECDLNPSYMHTQCAKSCKTCSKQSAEIRQKYCKNAWENEQECNQWAAEGECINNTPFMREQCAKSCMFCDYETRCKPFDYYQPALDLSNIPNPNMFQKVFFDLLSNKYLCHKYNISMLSLDPPIIQFNNFVPDMIVSELLKNGSFEFERSADAGELDENFVYKSIISNSRTSSNSWCDEECQQMSAAQFLLSSIEEVTGIDRLHFEQLQVLKYEVGEHYLEQHDFIDMQYDMPCGPRLLTLFVYLNDVEEGGETAFPRLGIKVKPQKGKAILWPNVLSNDPFEKLESTHHAALDVVKGRKYAINAWIHLFDFTNPHKMGCTG